MKAKTRFRRLDGILLLDKPAGISSNQALQRVRHLFRAEKAGHTGSLDPLATGLLPICFGEATKLAGLLLGSRKAYETVARLGVTTDSDDADGSVLRERPVPRLDDQQIDGALAAFQGRIAQRAPIYSALKQGGERLYALARRGETVDAPVREVEVEAFRLIGRDGDQLRLHVECGSGTYVRSLVRDLGEALGCGAHVVELRRLWVDPFATPAMSTMEELQELAADDGRLEARLLPLEAGLVGFTHLTVDEDAARRFGFGQVLVVDAAERGIIDAAEAQTRAVSSGATHGGLGLVAVKDASGRVLGLAAASGGRLVPKRLFTWVSQPAA